MPRTNYPAIETYMLRCMNDIAHDAEHVYRVLNHALDIAKHEPEADVELLSIACLLHDIARDEQFANPSVCHAARGGEKAHTWLLEQGYSERFAAAARDCIATHRFRSSSPPQSLEAKILFDADKLEACGAVGIARTLLYFSHTGAAEPLGEFLGEYEFKLSRLYDKFFTRRGEELAAKRQAAAQNFYEALRSEVREYYGEST